MAGTIKSITDHAGPDPIQGFDVDCWVSDASDGTMILFGSFTSIVVTIRNATEAYLGLNERIPRYLDGEVQIAWVMEKGMLDVNVLKQSFGFSEMTRMIRFNRSPRFQITFNTNTYGELNKKVTLLSALQPITDPMRDPDGRIELVRAKLDSFHFAATSGKQVVATQWQGVCEGIRVYADHVVGQYENVPGASTALPGITDT